MKILVTGASGYLGQGIVHKLLDDWHVVITAAFSCENINRRAITMLSSIFEIEDHFSYFDKPEATSFGLEKWLCP